MHWHKDRETEDSETEQITQIDLHIYRQLVFEKVSDITEWGKYNWKK